MDQITLTNAPSDGGAEPDAGPADEGDAPAAKRIYRRADEATWAKVRSAYLRGASAPACARLFGVSVSGLRQRAGKEGWARRAWEAACADGQARGDPGRFRPLRDARAPAPTWVPEDYRAADGSLGAGERGGERAGSKGSRARGGKGEAWGGPTWFRLTDEAWALIREEYLDGATAKQISARWRVACSSIYRRARQEGWTKDSRARRMVEEIRAIDAAEAEAETARRARAQALAAAAPPLPGALADAAFARASEAFATGRTDEAQRLLKLAAEARRMADAATARAVALDPAEAVATTETEPAPTFDLARDEIVITLDKLFDMTERWAELMIRGELSDMPAVLIHLAAHWRRANLVGPIPYGRDAEAVYKACQPWVAEVFEPDGSLKPLPDVDWLARYVWNRRDFPDIAQVPPKLRDLEAAQARRPGSLD